MTRRTSVIGFWVCAGASATWAMFDPVDRLPGLLLTGMVLFWLQPTHRSEGGGMRSKRKRTAKRDMLHLQYALGMRHGSQMPHTEDDDGTGQTGTVHRLPSTG